MLIAFDDPSGPAEGRPPRRRPPLRPPLMDKAVSLIILAGCVSLVQPRAVHQHDGSSCAAACTGDASSRSPLKWRVGSIYEYDFEGSTDLFVPVSEEDQRMSLKGKVLLTILSECEAAISLDDGFGPVETDGQTYPMVDVAKYPLRFGWNGGVVGRVCPDAEDGEWAVNVKRAALSALQNSLPSLDAGVRTVREVDVSGDCETVYDVTVPWVGGSTVVKKSKDLVKCKDRAGYRSSLQAESNLHDLSEVNNLPLIQSEHRCEQEVSSSAGVVSGVTCTETHAYRPLGGLPNLMGLKKSDNNVDRSEPEVRVKLSLTLKKTTPGSSVKPGSGRLKESCLRFHHLKKPFEVKNAASQAASLLAHVCAETENGVDASVPDDSYELLNILRQMTKEELLALRNKVKGGQICAATQRMEHYLNQQLVQAGGAGPIGVIVHMVKKEKTNKVERQLLEASLAFDLNPTVESVQAALPLLEGKSCPGAMLGVSALGHAYCRVNDQCAEEQPIKDLIAHLGRHLDGDSDSSCSPTREEDKETIIAALKAFGNLGRVDDTTEKKILRCATAKKVDPSIRNAAIEAFRRMPCEKPAKTELLNILTDSVDDSDIRIKAYLTVIGCACPKVVSKIEEVLARKEESKQVKWYIHAHIRNTQHSKAPSKDALRRLVKNVKTKDHTSSKAYKGHGLGFLKKSVNEEFSAYSRATGLGASAEANVIYSQRSYLPREANLNLTLELFGNTMNILEIGGRLQNAERAVDGIFGHGGTLKSAAKDVQTVIANKIEDLREEAENALNNKRSKRAASPKDYALISNQVDEGYGPKEYYKDDPSADIYVRIFGNELLWLPFSKKKLEEAMNEMEEAVENKFQNVDALSSIKVLYGSMYVPTAIGVPLKVHANATLTVGLKYEESDAQFNFPDSKLNLKVTPSAILTVAGTMVVNAYSVRRGVRVVATVKATPSVDVEFSSSKDGVEARLNLPKGGGDMDLFKLSAVTYSLTKPIDGSARLTPLKLPTTDKKTKVNTAEACIPGLGKLLGVTLCYASKLRTRFEGPPKTAGDVLEMIRAVSSSVVPGPFMYPAEAAFKLKREDPGLKGYELVGKWKMKGTEDSELAFYVDAPGSKEDRRIGVSLSARKDAALRKYQVFLKTPWKKLSASLDYTEDVASGSRRFTAEAREDEDVYALNLNVGVEKLSGGERKVYTPSLDWTHPREGNTKLLKGKIDYVKAKKVDFELEPLAPALLDGSSVRGSLEFDWSSKEKKGLKVNTLELDLKDVLKISTTGSGSTETTSSGERYSFDFATDVGNGKTSESLKLAGSMTDNSGTDKLHLKTDFTAECSLLPDWGQIKVEEELKKEPGHFLFDLVLTRGKDKGQFKLHDEVRYSGLGSLSSVNIDGVLRMSDALATDVGFDLLHTVKVDAKNLNHVWNLDYTYEGEKKAIRTLVDLVDSGSVEKPDLALKVLLSGPGKSYELVDSFKQVEKGVYVSDTELRVTPGDTYNLKVNIVDQQKSDAEEKADRTTTQKLDATLRSTGWTNPVEGTLSRTVQPGVLVMAGEVQAEGERKLRSELEWRLNDGKGTASTERFEMAISLFLKSVVDARGKVKNEHPVTDMDISVELFPRRRVPGLDEGRKLTAKARIEDQGRVGTTGDESRTSKRVTAEVALEANKGPSKKISLESDLTYGAPVGHWEIRAKNKIGYAGQQYKIDLEGQLARKVDVGETGLKMEITLPSKKTLFSDTRFKVDTKSDSYNNEILLNFKTLDDDYYKLKAVTGVLNKNYRQITGDLKMDIVLDTPVWGGTSVITANSTKTGSLRNVALSGTVTPNTKSDGFEGTVLVSTEPGKQLGIGLKASRGNDVYVDFDSLAKFDMTSKVKDIDLVLSLASPAMDLKPLTIDNKVKSYWNNIHDTKTTGKFIVISDGTRYVLDTSLDAGAERILGSVKAVYKNEKIASLDLNVDKSVRNVYKGRLDAEGFGNKATLSAEHRRDSTKSWKLAYTINAELLLLGFDAAHSLQIERKENAGSLVSKATLDGDALYDLSVELLGADKTKSLKAKFLSGDDQQPKTVDVSLTKTGRSAYALDGKVRWSESNGYAEISGEAKYNPVPLSFEFKTRLDSPELNVNNWEILGSSKLDGNRRSILFKADKAGEKDNYLLELSYVKDASNLKGNGRLYLGAQHKYTADFSLPIDWVNQDVPALISVKSVTPVGAGAGGKKQQDQALFKDIEVRREKLSGYKEVVYSLKISIKKSTYGLRLGILNNKPDSGIDGKITLGFKAQAKKGPASSFETVAALNTQNGAIVGELITSQGEGDDAKRFGISGEARSGKLASSLYILERVIREDLTWEKTEEEGRCRLSAVYKLWLDHTREPNQVLTATLNLREEEALKGWRYTAACTLGHPSLEKDMKVTQELVILGEETWLYSKAVFDVYPAGQSPLEASVELSNRHPSEDDWENHFHLIVTRPNDLDFRVVRDVKRKGHIRSFSLKFSGGKSLQDSAVLEATALLDCGENGKANLALKGPGQVLELEGIEEKDRRKRARSMVPRARSGVGLQNTTGSRRSQETKWVWTLKQTDAVPIQIEVIYSTDIAMPALSIQVYDQDAPTKRLRLRAGYVNPSLIDMKFDSVDGDKETLYFRRTFILRKEQHVLSHQMSWKKENFRGLWEGTKYRGKMVGEHMLEGIKSAHQVVSRWHKSYEETGRLEPAIDPLKDALQVEVEELIEELESDPTVLTLQAFAGIGDLRSTLESVVDYYKNLHKNLNSAFDKLLELIEKALGDDLGFTVADVHNWVDRTGDELEKTWRDLKAVWNNILDEVKSGKDQIDFETVLDFLDNVLEKIKSVLEFADDFFKELKEEYKINEMMESLEMLGETMESLLEYVWECRYFKPLKEFYDGVKQWLKNELKVDRKKLNQVWADMKDYSNNAFESSGGKFVVWRPEEGEIEIDFPVPEGLTTLQLPLSPLQKMVESAKETGLVRIVWDWIKRMASQYEKQVYPELSKAVEALSLLVDDALSPSNIRAILAGLASSSSQIGDFFPSSGSGESYFETHSSLLHDHQHDQTFVESLMGWRERARPMMELLEQSPLSLGNVARSSWLNDMLGGMEFYDYLHSFPPFKASAYISGHDHLVTFDRQVHNWVGRCRYLLARENVDGKFTLEADYSGTSDTDHPRKSLIFNVLKPDGSYDSILIGANYEVTLNGAPVGTPFRVGNVWVTMESPTLLQVNWDEEGVSLACDTEDQFCRFRLTGWLHGRVSGLLGTNDRERVTDMLSPAGKHVPDLAALAAEWRLSSNCPTSPSTYNGPGLPACGRIFKDPLSPYSSCFKKVDPEAFSQACMNLPLQDKDGLCHLTLAYRTACLEKGHPLPLADECKKCEFQGREVKEGTESEVNTSGTQADVVVVIQQASCLSGVIDLDTFIKEIRNQAKQQGTTDLQVGVIGYGNKDINRGQATVFSSNNGRVWLGDMDLVPGLDFKGETKKGTLEALLMATEFHFRPQASKAAVLLTCTACQRGVRDLLYNRYYEVEKKLLQRGITLHTLSSQDVQANKGKKKALKQIIGVDSKAAFKLHSLKGGEFQPDEALRGEVSLQPDYCTQLSQSSHGSVFSLPRLLESEDKAKNFRQVFARRIVSSLSGPGQSNQCQKCTCKVKPWGPPSMECELCNPRIADLNYHLKDQL